MSATSYRQLEAAVDRFERSVAHLPFRHRGIKISAELIMATLEVLNAEPTRTLPQNCRNAIRSKTPDGLDCRVKEKMNHDTRTANIVSDLLVQAGIVEVVRVKNPVTGRMVKGTRLLEEQRW
jgi:hypothetical protein